LTQNSPKGLYYLLASSPLTNPSKERAIPLPEFHGSIVSDDRGSMESPDSSSGRAPCACLRRARSTIILAARVVHELQISY